MGESKVKKIRKFLACRRYLSLSLSLGQSSDPICFPSLPIIVMKHRDERSIYSPAEIFEVPKRLAAFSTSALI